MPRRTPALVALAACLALATTLASPAHADAASSSPAQASPAQSATVQSAPVHGEAGPQDSADPICGSQAQVLTYPTIPVLRGETVTVTIGGAGLADARSLELQVLTDTGWTTVASTIMPPMVAPIAQWYPFDAPLPAAYSTGTVTVQAYLAPSATCPAAASPPVTLTFTGASYTYGGIAGQNTIDGKVTAGATRRLKIRASARLDPVAGVTPAPTTRWTVQRAGADGVWHALKAKVSVSEGTGQAQWLTATVPALSTSRSHPGGRYRYRFVPDATAQVDPTPSPALTVTYFNTKKVARHAANRYCRSTPLKYRSAAPASMEAPGEVAGWVQVGQNRINLVWDTVAALPRASLEQVVYHECAHRLQYLAYAGHASYAAGGKAAWQELEKDAARWFSRGGSEGGPVEHLADCVAQDISGRSGTSVDAGYGGTCSAKQLKLARRLLAGKRL